MWFLLYLNLFTILFSYTCAITDEEVKMEFTKKVAICVKTNPVDVIELLKLQEFKIPTDNKTKCLLACAYKEEGTLNATGFYDLNRAFKKAELISNGDAKRLQNGRKLAEFCSKINGEKVSDGDNGCDRAALLFKCLVDNIPKFGFKL